MKKSLFVLLACALAASSQAVESIKGVYGNAALFDGRKAYLVDPARKPFDYSKGITVGLYFRGDAWAQQSAMITNAGSFQLRKRLKGNRGFYVMGTVNKKRDTGLMWSPEKFPAFTGKWYHMAFSFDPQTGIGVGYVNGKKVADFDVKKSLGVPAPLTLDGNYLKQNEFMLGNGTVPYQGAMDEVYIYGRVLNEREVYLLSRNQPPAGAQAAYKMDDPDNIGKDSSGCNRHLAVRKSFLAEPPPRTGSKIATDYLYKQPGLTVWSRPASEKNMPADQPVIKALQSEPSAKLAANEYESFQIAVSPEKELKNLKLELTPFKLGKSELKTEIFTVKYVAIPEISQTGFDPKTTDIFGEAATSFAVRTAFPGYYPDVLPPGNTFKVAPAGESSAFWITVKSAPGQKAGIYSSTATLTADGNVKIQFPVKVQVWDFELPAEKHTHNSGVARDSLGKDSDAFYKNLSEHYVSVTPLRATPRISVSANDEISINTDAFDKEAALAIDKHKLNVLYFPGWDFYNMPKASISGATWNNVQIQHDGHLTERFKKVFGKYLQMMSKHLEKKGYLKYTRITLSDEPWTAKDFNLCQEFAKLVRENAPKVKIMVTKWPQPGLFGAPDIWCLGFFQHKRMQEALARGEQLEFYPNWHVFIDRPLMDSRMMGFLMWKYQITGILFWKLNHGWSNKRNLEAPRYVYPDGRVVCGSGLLIYPDEKNNPVSSIRWEMFRDAFEDFEYLYMLDKLIKKQPGTAAAKQAAELIRTACDTLVTNYEAYLENEGYGWKQTKWEFNAGKLRDFREKVAETIVKMK